MYIQRDIFRDAVGMTFNQTHEERLEKAGQLLRMLLFLSSNQVSGLGQTGGSWRLLDFLTTIQLVGNGDRVIQNLNAREHQYRGYAGGGKVAPDTWRNYASNTQFCLVPLILGRSYKDLEYGLDLGAWDEVRLKITNTATSSQFTTNIAVTIFNHFLRDAAPGALRGYIKAEAHRDYLPVAGDTTYIDLPTMGKLHRLLVHSRPGVDASNIATTAYSNLAHQLTLKAKSRTLELMDHSAARLAYENWYDEPSEVLTMGSVYINADAGFDVGVGRVFGWAGISSSKDDAVSATIPTVADRNDFTQENESYEGDSPIAQMWRGFHYHNIASLPVSWGPNPEQWLSLEDMKQVTLDILTRSGVTVGTGAYNRVLLERPAAAVDRLL